MMHERTRVRGWRWTALLALLLWASVVGAPRAEEGPAAEGDAPRDVEIWRGDRVSVMTGDVVVPRDTILRGNVICIGSDAVIEGEVTGGVVVVMGSLRAPGRIGRDIVGVLSELDVSDGQIDYGIVNVLGSLDREDAVVRGEVVNVSLGNWFPGVVPLLNWWTTFELLAAFVALVLIVAMVPERVRLIADEAPVRYVSAFFVGLLAYVLAWLLGVLLLATIIGFPIFLVFCKVIKWLGLAAIFYAVGRRVGRGFDRDMSMLGAVLLVFAVLAAALLLPGLMGVPGVVLRGLIKLVFWTLFAVPAVGLVLLTRFGTRTGNGSGRTVTPSTVSAPEPAPEPAAPPSGPDEPGTPPAPSGMRIGPARAPAAEPEPQDGD